MRTLTKISAPVKKRFRKAYITQTENLLNEMGKMAKIGAWELDTGTMRQLWTEETYAIHDVDKATYNPNVDREVNSFTPKSKPIIERAVKAAIAEGKPYDLELEMVTVKGNHKIVRCIGNIYKEGGKVKKVYGSVQDITEFKKMDQAKTEFVSLVSHQLRTPLTAINWYTEMILGGDTGPIMPAQKKYLEEIYRGNHRMIELVNTILDVSRIELGTFKMEFVNVDVIQIVQAALLEQQPLIDRKKLKITKKFSDNIPGFLSDPKFLHMIFQNLLANAVEYTPAGGSVSLEICLSSAGLLFIKISDTGCGIPKNQEDRIFTKLFRADNVRARDTDGTGLGLYIVKSVVESLGGRIWFDSEENKGTAFYVTLPLSQVKEA
jgi:signal transduction histidine kinase